MTCASCLRDDFASSLRCQWCGTPLQAGVSPLAASVTGAVSPNVISPPNAVTPSVVAPGAAPLSQRDAFNEPHETPKTGGLKKVFGPVLAIVALLFGKLKVLLGALKFGKLAGTFVSMFVSIAFYAVVFSWKFAIGFVVLLFVHEMGHVIALKRRGIPIEGMYFIPFLGAAVSFKKRPPDPAVDAEISWAGPFAGLLGGAVCAALFFQTGNVFWAVLAHVTFLLNLINLAPAVPLDGGWIVKAIHPKFAVFGSLIGAGIGLYLHSTMLVIIAALGAFHAWGAWKAQEDDFDKPEVSPQARLRISGAYLALLIVLGSALAYSTHVLHEDRLQRQGQDDTELSASARIR